MIADRVFFDTWAWVALGHRKDSSHSAVLALYRDVKASGLPPVTSDYVLAEVATLLFRRNPFDEAERFMADLLEAGASGLLAIEAITPERFARAWDLRRKYRDKPLNSFTDLFSMALMLELGLFRIATADQHFSHVGLGFRLLP